jgi:hypothetical protein
MAFCKGARGKLSGSPNAPATMAVVSPARSDGDSFPPSLAPLCAGIVGRLGIVSPARSDGDSFPPSLAPLCAGIVGRLGIEPRTYGLKGHGDHEQLHAVNPDLILRGSFIALQVLQLAAKRDPEVLDAARKLAAIVLGDDQVRFAHNVRRSDPFAVVHAVKLAALVIARSTDAVRHGIAETK